MPDLTRPSITRRLRIVVVAAPLVVVGLATPTAGAAGARPTAPKPTIVLVHGAWADASSWAKVTGRLHDVDLYVKSAVFPGVFANDLPSATAAQLAAAQRPIALSALLEPSGTPAWKTLPNWYLLGANDHILPPALQLSMARRAHSRVTKVPSSHLAMLSRPDAVTDLIIAAARATS